MVHFTCDLCGQQLEPNDGQRYVVKMETFASCDVLELTEEDLDADHLEEIGELLREMEQDGAADVEEFKSFRFDLCCQCYKKFLKNPLGKQTIHRFDFSEN